MNHAVAWFTQPNQIRYFIDSIKWKLIFNVVTILLKHGWEGISTAFTFSFVPAVSILPVHIILKIHPSLCVCWHCNIVRGVNGWTVTWQWLVLSTIAHIPSAPFHCIRRHFLVKWLGFIVTMRDERISYTKPFSFDPYSKCSTALIS